MVQVNDRGVSSKVNMILDVFEEVVILKTERREALLRHQSSGRFSVGPLWKAAFFSTIGLIKAYLRPLPGFDYHTFKVERPPL